MKQTGKQINGAQQLTPQQEAMRMEVVDLEMKARYWKAQFEIRHYTLEAEKVQGPYDEYLEAQKKKNAELQKQFEEQMAELQKTGGIRIDEPEVEKPGKVYDEGDTYSAQVQEA